MKRLFISIMLALMTASSYGYDLNITQDDIIIHNQDDWVYIGKTDLFSLYVEKSMIEESKDHIIDFHAYIEFNKLEDIQYLDAPVSRIYTYGKLNCPRGEMMMLTDMYTSSENKVVFRQYFPVGTAIADMKTPNTMRLEAYKVICSESI